MDISINTAAKHEAVAIARTSLSLKERFNNFADRHAHNRTTWFIASLMAQGVLFLPVPAVLVYYFNAPVPVVVITLSLFFANVIAGMGGARVRTMIYLFAASALIHILLLAGFMIF